MVYGYGNSHGYGRGEYRGMEQTINTNQFAYAYDWLFSDDIAVMSEKKNKKIMAAYADSVGINKQLDQMDIMI